MKQRDYVWFFVHMLLGLAMQLMLSEGWFGLLGFVCYPYVMPFLLMPMQVLWGRQLIMAALWGLLIDMLYGTWGAHMAAMVAMVYARSWILIMLTPSSLLKTQVYPRATRMGWSWYMIYITTLLFLHQLCIFVLELWDFYHVSLLKAYAFTLLFFCLIEVFHAVFAGLRRSR